MLLNKSQFNEIDQLISSTIETLKSDERVNSDIKLVDYKRPDGFAKAFKSLHMRLGNLCYQYSFNKAENDLIKLSCFIWLNKAPGYRFGKTSNHFELDDFNDAKGFINLLTDPMFLDYPGFYTNDSMLEGLTQEN